MSSVTRHHPNITPVAEHAGLAEHTLHRMVASDSFAEFLREQLAPLGRVTSRAAGGSPTCRDSGASAPYNRRTGAGLRANAYPRNSALRRARAVGCLLP